LPGDPSRGRDDSAALVESEPYIEDFRSGNVTVFQMIRALAFWAYHNTVRHWSWFGSVMRWAYDVFMKAVGARLIRGALKSAKRRAHAGGKLDVQEGEMVRVKDYNEILQTLTKSGRTAAFISTRDGTLRQRHLQSAQARQPHHR